VGAPGAYDYGPERTSWMIHHLTNWCGDAGFVTGSRTQIRRHNPEGDILFIRGTVTGKRVTDDGQHLIDISQEASNQDGEKSVAATATVRLPSRG
jgi:hypothetical protein